MSKLSLKNITKKIGSGATPTGGQNAYQNSGISLIRSQNVHDFAFLKNGLAYINEEQANNLNNVIVLENDILLNITGDSIARVCKVPKEILPARVNQHVMIIRASSAVDSNYLLCYLQFLKPYLLKICGVGGTRNALTKDVIENLLVELPNLSIQNSIGLLIDNINAKIELNNRINAVLEQMAKTLYDYWFVQFDFPCLPPSYSSARNALADRPSGQVNPNDEVTEKIRAVCTYKATGGMPLPDGKKWFVYVLLCTDGSFYKGMTNDLYRRYFEHYTGAGANHTKIHKPVKVIHWEEFENQADAAKREKELKTGYGRTWIQRQYDKYLNTKSGSPAPKTELRMIGSPAPKTELRMAGKMVWSEELKREVPEGWEVKLLAEWLEISKSGDWGKEVMEGNYTEKVYCFRGADINGLNGVAELKPPTRFILEKNKSKILEANDLIVEISGGSPTQSTGRMAYITEATLKRFDLPLICSNFCKPISLKNKKLLYNFAYYWNSLYDSGVFFGFESKTSGIKNLLFDSFVSTYYTIVPNENVVDKFYSIMEGINKKKQNNLSENQKLTELRDWLLPMLMNGQVKVGEDK